MWLTMKFGRARYDRPTINSNRMARWRLNRNADRLHHHVKVVRAIAVPDQGQAQQDRNDHHTGMV